MADPRMTDELVELVAEHFGCDVEDVEFHSADQRPEEISGQWNECSRDLSHLSRGEKQDYLQRRIAFRPITVGDVTVTLYNDVQPNKGQPRVKAAIIDFGDRCQIASY